MIKGSRGNKYKERRPLQLVGQRFTRLIVVADLGLRPRKDSSLCQRWWSCLCDCGKSVEATTTALRKGSTKSCGCYGAERRRKASIIALTKHGHATVANRRPEYNVFKTMHARCHNPNNEKYPRYGGRGITIEPRWHDYENFYADMGQRPSSAHQIERRNNNGNYGPDNCYWATPTEQARNRKSNRLVTINGETHCVAEWAERTVGVSQFVLLYRLNAGWPTAQLLTPTRKGNPNAICK